MLEENLYFSQFNNNNPKFTSWNLAQENLNEEDLTKLSAILSQNPFITSLDLSSNNITGHRMEIIAAGLSRNKSLRVLKLNNNGINDEDLVILITALRQSNIILDLSLANNRFRSVSARLLINLQSLESLDLSTNDIGIAIAKMMKKLKNLHSLNYANNYIQNAGIVFLMHELDLMSLDISNTGMSEAFTISPNSSLISLQSFYICLEEAQNVWNIIKRNKNNMIIRYQHFVNLITLFACHHFSQRSNNNDTSAFNSLPLELQLKILNFAIPFRGKKYGVSFVSEHIGLGPSKIAELINKIYKSAEMVKKSSGIVSMSAFLAELNRRQLENNLPTQNTTLVPQLTQASIQFPIREIPPPLPLSDITTQSSNATINPAVLRLAPLTPPRPTVKLPSVHSELLAQEQQGYENWQQFLEEAKDWNLYIETKNSQKLLPPSTDEVAKDEDTESDFIKVDTNSAFVDHFCARRAEIITQNFACPTKSPKSPVRSLFWSDQSKSPIKSPKRPAATSLSAPLDSPTRSLKAKTQ